MKRRIGMLLVICCLLGCDTAKDVLRLDDDEDDADRGGGNITVEALRGTWLLDLDDSTLDDGDIDGNAVIQTRPAGVWRNVDGRLPQGFLSALDSTLVTATELRITGTQFTFVTNTGNVVLTATPQETADTFQTVRLRSSASTPADVVITIPSDGDEMTIDDSGRIGRFSFSAQNARQAITDYTLVINDTRFVTTIRRDGQDEPSVTQTYTLDEDPEEIDLADEPIPVEVDLANGNTRLTLTFNDGRIGEFRRQ